MIVPLVVYLLVVMVFVLLVALLLRTLIVVAWMGTFVVVLGVIFQVMMIAHRLVL